MKRANHLRRSISPWVGFSSSRTSQICLVCGLLHVHRGGGVPTTVSQPRRALGYLSYKNNNKAVSVIKIIIKQTHNNLGFYVLCKTNLLDRNGIAWKYAQGNGFNKHTVVTAQDLELDLSEG